MRFIHLTLTAILYIRFAFSTPASSRTPDRVIHERRADNPEWRPMRRVERAVLIPLRIALKQSNLDGLPDFLLAVSDPSSPKYGSHWTPEKVVDIFSPGQEAHNSVHEWLKSVGVEKSRIKTSRNRAWIEIQAATIDEAERLLQAEYHIFENDNGEQQVACHSYSLPHSVATHVDFVTPTVQPNIVRSHPVSSTTKVVKRDVSEDISTRAIPGPLAGCDIAIVPNCLHALYNMTYTPQATDRNSLGVVSYVPNTFLQSDLNLFFANVSPSLVGHSPLVVSIDHGSIAVDATSNVGETSVILQYAMALAEPQNVTLLQVGGTPPGSSPSFNEWLDAVDGSYCTSDGGDDFTYDPQLPNPAPGGLKEHSCGITRAPNVVSNSQAFQENRFSQFYLQRQCNEFAKLGLMGVTVLYGSGDQGTAQGGYCLDENKSVNLNATNFNPSWPSSCPWITSVGGTQLLANVTIGSGTQEAAWNALGSPNIFQSSGGGFSNHFPTPIYQKSAVDKYLNALKKSNPALLTNFNQTGRAYPDLSATASNIGAVSRGLIGVGSGTSFSTPVVAAVITLVNDARIAAGKKPVGFINPTIYSPAFATAFNDVTSGTIQGCKGRQGVSDGGFAATPGWDPATGLGTPNLGLLIERWLSLP